MNPRDPDSPERKELEGLKLMPPEYERLFRTPVQTRIIERRTPMLDRLLKQAGLKTLHSVECAPQAECRPSRCFINSEEVAAKRGGKLLTGWIFEEYLGRYITGIAHGIWLAPDGKRWDVTPHQFQPRRVLFSPDPRVALKRGYTTPPKLMTSDDPQLIAIERFDGIMDKLHEDRFTGFGTYTVITNGEIEQTAQECGLPIEVALHLVHCRHLGFKE